MFRYKNNNNGDFCKIETSFSGCVMSDDIVIDKSRFKPTLVNNDFGQRVDGLAGVPQYHFPDGKDFGLHLTSINRLGSDITEIEHDYQLLKNRVDSQQLQFEKEFQNETKKLTEDVVKNSQSSVNQNHSQGGQNG